MESKVSTGYYEEQNQFNSGMQIANAPPESRQNEGHRGTTQASLSCSLDSPACSYSARSDALPSLLTTPNLVETRQFPNDLRPRLYSRQNSSVSINQISQMLSEDQVDTDTYGVSDSRDGFFDAIFLKPPPLQTEELLAHAATTLPRQFDKGSPLALEHFIPRQWHEIKSLVRRVTTTRAGIRLLRPFVAFFVAYVLCLIAPVMHWLGRYYYVTAISVILNHPARTLGSQIDGTILSALGIAAGLGWGVVGLLLSTSTLAAKAGYGGVLAMFLALFIAIVAWIRSDFIRLNQAVICAGIAITFTTLADTSNTRIDWTKLRSFGVSWLLGQAISLVVNCLVFPDAGARPLAAILHRTFDCMTEALAVPSSRDVRLRRRLTRAFVDISEAHRDLRLDLSISHFHPDDIHELRNLVQAVIRALLSMGAETWLFDEDSTDGDVVVQINNSTDKRPHGTSTIPNDLSEIIRKKLVQPTKDVMLCMREGLQRCDATLMDLSGYRRDLGPPSDISASLSPIQIKIDKAKAAFDVAESAILDSSDLAALSTYDSDVIRLFVFARHVREAVPAVEALMVKVCAMQDTSEWPRIYLPSYPFKKAIRRTNAQVRHDRGGVTAGSYQATFAEIARLLDKIKARDHRPSARSEPDGYAGVNLQSVNSHATINTEKGDDRTAINQKKLGYKVWRVLYRLQGFESRYALKACLVITLLSIPSYLDNDHGWWDRYEVWWTVAISWIVMHPRVGGNLQDLVTRAIAAILGAAWSGAAYAAGNGNRFVMAAFAAVYMVPMLYRFTQSSHPRSGLVGCISFTVISLGLCAQDQGTSPTSLVVNKGLVFLVGTTVPVVVNWVLWPFVARHELRFALSSMLFFMSVMYRSVVAKYVYYEQGKGPTAEDIKNSEILEGRLREGFVRLRQLLVLTRHELRLRETFDPLPYSALADACELFFEYIVAVRQSALFYNTGPTRDTNTVTTKKLLGYRRDAVATILANLYILAGALRSQRKLPRYLPSAAAARKKLLVKTAEVDEETAQRSQRNQRSGSKLLTKWGEIYGYSYNESLTGCVAQLEQMEKYTKLIVGEQGGHGEGRKGNSVNQPTNI